MNIAYIMRGVPGSGKSTVARMLVANGGVVHNSDQYFYVDGEYVFDPTLLSKYHNRNLMCFCESLRQGEPVVVGDSTNIKRKDFQPYVDAATKAGYMVVFVVLPHPDPEVAASRTLHNIPAHIIQRRIENWEN